MLLALLIAYALEHTLAAPIGRNALQSDFIPTNSCNYPDAGSQRSVLEILWSCFVTIFACIWISVHPNVPSPDDSWWTITRRRIKVTLWALLAPELTLAWAMRQWLGAREIAQQYKDRGWKMTHGFFLQMGGFMLCVNGEPQQTLTFQDFKTLHLRGKIEWPSISEEEIWDKSKGDILAKSFVLLQTLWFIIQCIARGVQHLAVTELELVTLGFAVLNGMMYFFWWYKPLDIRVPHNIQYRGQRMPTYDELSTYESDLTPFATIQLWQAEYEEPQIDNLQDDPDPNKSLAIANSAVSTLVENDKVTAHCHLERKLSMNPAHTAVSPPEAIEEIDLTDLHTPSEMCDPDLLPGPAQSQAIGPISAEAPSGEVASNLRPHKVSPGQFPTATDTLHVGISKPSLSAKVVYERFIVTPITSIVSSIVEMQTGRYPGKAGTSKKRISTFYSLQRTGLDHIYFTEYVVYFLFGGIFGGIHCIGWTFHFLSYPEELMWKISSIIIVIVPLYLGINALSRVAVYFLYLRLGHHDAPVTSRIKYFWLLNPWIKFMRMLLFAMFPAMFLYLAARIMLLAESFLALRDPPPEALDNVQWTNFIPHF